MRAYSNTSAIVGVSMMMQVLSMLLIVLRFTARWTRKQKLRADDWLMIPSIIFATSLVGLDIYSFVTLPTLHSTDSTKVVAVEHAQFSMYVLTAAAMCFIKCSIACLYKRVFLGSTFARIVNSVIGILVTWAVLFIFGIIFGCGTDFQSTFPSPGRVSCRAYYRMGIVAFSLDIALDLLLAILPLPMVYRLQMPLRKKLGLGSIFLVGFVAVGAAAARTAVWVEHVGSANELTLTRITAASIWNLVSVHAGILTACLPTIGPLLNALWSSKAGIRARVTLSRVLPWSLLRPNIGDKRSQLSAATQKQRSNPLISSAHVSDADIEAVPSDMEMQSGDVYIRRDMIVEQEDMPEPLNVEGWITV